MIKDKNILITGGGGFIGSWLVEKLCLSNNVTIFDNGRRNSIKFLDKELLKGIEIIKGDITNYRTVEKVTKKKDVIIHLAAIAGASFYETDPLQTLSVNLLGSENLLKSLVKSNVSSIIIFSSSEVYGKNAINVSEDDPTCVGSIFEGRWSYAISKVATDHFAMSYFKKYFLPVSIVRPFNIYGPRQVGEGAIANMIKTAISDKKIYVTGDGKQERSWCYVDDLSEAVVKIVSKKISGECFNIGNPSANVSTLKLAKMISKKFSKVSLKNISPKKTEIIKRKPNIRRANKILGWEPKTSLSEGIDSTIEWYLGI